MTYPFVLLMGNSIFLGYSSSTVSLWILDSTLYSLIKNPINFFNANIYYPLDNTRVFGDISIFTSTIYSIFKLIFNNPIFCYNLLLFFTFPLTGMSLYYLINYNTNSNLSSLALSTFFTFCLTRMPYFCHIQIINFFLIPLAILYWQKFLDKEKWQYFLITAICLVLQFYTGYYNFSFLTVFLFIMTFIYKPSIITNIFKSNLWKQISIIAIISLLLLLPTIATIAKASKEYDMKRKSSVITGLKIQHYFGASDKSLLYSNFFKNWRPDSKTMGKEGSFNGFLIYLLLILSIVYTFKKNGIYKKKTRIFLLLSIFAFLFSLGNEIYFLNHRICSGPYKYLRLFPLLIGVRAPFRFVNFFALFISITSSFGIANLLSDLKTKKSYKIALIALIILIFLIENRVNYKRYFAKIPYNKSIPQYYNIIKECKDTNAIFEFPYFLPGNDRRIHSKREYFSIYHKKNIVGGFSGFIPPYIINLTSEAIFFPNNYNRMLSFLIGHNINYIIINKQDYQLNIGEFYTVAKLSDTIDRFKKAKDFELFYDDNEAYIFKLKNHSLEVETNESKIFDNLTIDFNFPDRVKPKVGFIGSISMKNNSTKYLVPQMNLLNKKYYIKIDWMKNNIIHQSNAFKGYLKNNNQRNTFWLNREMWFPFLLEPSEISIKQFKIPAPVESGEYLVRISGYIANYEINTTKLISIDKNLKYSIEIPNSKFLMEYISFDIPKEMKTDSLYQAVLKIKNNSDYNFYNLYPIGSDLKTSNPKGLVRITAFWADTDQKILDKKLVYSPIRNNLICDVSPGQIVELPFIIHTPRVPGKYNLTPKLINEYVGWGENEFSKPPTISVTITK